MGELVLQILGAGISLLNEKEKHKYVDKYLDLKKRYNEEINRPENEYSDDFVARVELELLDLGRAFAISVGQPSAPNQ